MLLGFGVVHAVHKSHISPHRDPCRTRSFTSFSPKIELNITWPSDSVLLGRVVGGCDAPDYPPVLPAGASREPGCRQTPNSSQRKRRPALELTVGLDEDQRRPATGASSSCRDCCPSAPAIQHAGGADLTAALHR